MPKARLVVIALLIGLAMVQTYQGRAWAYLQRGLRTDGGRALQGFCIWKQERWSRRQTAHSPGPKNSSGTPASPSMLEHALGYHQEGAESRRLAFEKPSLGHRRQAKMQAVQRYE